MAFFNPGILALFLCFSLMSCAQKYPAPLQVQHSNKELRSVQAGVDSMRLVDLRKFLPGVMERVHYATEDNFTGRVLYTNPGLYLRKTAAEKLKAVQDSLVKRDLQLVIYDAYRPYRVTREMWKGIEDERYVANPAKGSGHNRGIAVDLTLARYSTGELLAMPTGYDNFSDTAHIDFCDLPEAVIENRQMLMGIMEHFGFIPLDTEWWHYYLPESRPYPLMDFSFPQLSGFLSQQ